MISSSSPALFHPFPHFRRKSANHRRTRPPSRVSDSAVRLLRPADVDGDASSADSPRLGSAVGGRALLQRRLSNSSEGNTSLASASASDSPLVRCRQYNSPASQRHTKALSEIYLVPDASPHGVDLSLSPRRHSVGLFSQLSSPPTGSDDDGGSLSSASVTGYETSQVPRNIEVYNKRHQLDIFRIKAKTSEVSCRDLSFPFSVHKQSIDLSCAMSFSHDHQVIFS